MHASQARPRHHERLDEDELFAVARGGDRSSEPYSRPHRNISRAEPYGGSSAAQRSYTDASSRGRRAEDWRVIEAAYVSSAHDRYHDDVVAHSRRDEYHDRSETWSSRSTQHSQYASTRREWTKGDDHGYTSTSHSESRAWGRTSRYEEPTRNTNGNDDWLRDEARHERERERYSRDESHPARERGLRARDDVVTVESTRDRRSSNWAEKADDRPQWRRDDRERGREKERDIVHEPDRASHGVDRQWEPAAAWKSGERDDPFPVRYERTETLQPFSRSNKKPGKNKKKGQQVYQKRDVKRDDNMNNWQRREYYSTQKDKDIVKPSTGKRRHEYSPDSRSRSPARSIYSRRSSNRSRSRSLSPKRRKRGEEPLVRTATNPVTKRSSSRRSHSPVWSPSSPVKARRVDEDRDRLRPPSISSRSSESRSRSRSGSEGPDVKPKQKHRLPTATSLRDIEMQAKSLRMSVNAPPRQSKDVKKGSSGKAGGKLEPQSSINSLAKSREAVRALVQRDEHEAMPPPANPASTPVNGKSSVVYSSSTVAVDPQPKVAKRNAGFKPIGLVQSNAAMKRFFPDEDDESDSNASQAKAPQNDQDAHQPFRRGENANDARQRQGRDTSSSHRSDRDAEMRHQRESWTKPSLLRNGESIHRDDVAEARHRRDEANIRTPVSRQPAAKSSAYRDSSLPDILRQGVPPPLNGETYVNGAASREGSVLSGRPSDFPGNTDSVLPSPAGQQVEDVQSTEHPSEVPKDQVYAIVSQVGEGTFGKVYKARNNATGVHVALKRIRMETERDGFPVTAMREIKLLQSLRHVNIVQLMEMMVHHGSVYMVFEYMDHDLTGVLSQTQFSFTDAHLKSLCQQMLQGLSYLHRKGVIHRDIKGSNILLNNRGELKLADFGLARFYQKRRRADYTNRVITLWYRPPELLLGTTVYGPEVDMWSAGCIMLELFCKKPVFQGNDEIHQLDVIYKILGTPTPEEWPSVTDMPWYELVKPKETLRNRFRELFNKWLSSAALDLAESLLSYDPAQRATADQALEAAYFSQEEPSPILPIGLASLEGEWHEFESKRERAKKRRRLDSVAGTADSSGLPPQ